MTMALAEVLAANSKDSMVDAIGKAGIKDVLLPDGNNPTPDMLANLGESLLGAVKDGLEGLQQIGIG